MNLDIHQDTKRQIWLVWAENLRRWGIGEWVAAALEAAGPLTVLGAQCVYLGQPLLRLAVPDYHLNVLAQTLEEPSQSQAFVSLLREELPG
ncbi:MAG: hypothetical protein GX495_09810 [Chloroflexi bacterium]|nr:hypothetical protein [Chloroflexota bacterium]